MKEDRHPKALFRDRAEAGQKLACKLGAYASREELVVLAQQRAGRRGDCLVMKG